MMYIFSACRAGLQQLLSIISQYGVGSDTRFNAGKSTAMIIRCKKDRKSVFLGFNSSGEAFEVSSEVRYLDLG